jgi:hypothetical protein
MSTYRETPAPEPLLLTIGQMLLAIEPGTGALCWQLRLPVSVRRMFRVEHRMFLVGEKRVLTVDVSTGKSVGGTELGFTPSTGLVHESRLFLAGASAAACLDLDCRILWEAVQPAMAETWSFDFALSCKGEDGSVLWSVDLTATGTPPGMCLGNLISQPDLDS